MKRGLYVVFLLILTLNVYALVNEPVLDEEQIEQIDEITESIEDFIQRVAEAELDNYNRLIIEVKDTQGNPKDCTIRVWYDDFIQEYVKTTNGKYDNVFHHEKQLPTELLSFAIDDCNCWPVASDIEGPKYPALNDLLERIKQVAAEDIKEKAIEEGSEAAEKVGKQVLERFFEGMGMSADLAGAFIGGVKIGADLGAPIGDYITKKIEEIFQQMRELEKIAHAFEWNQPWFPRKWKRTPWVDTWIGWHKPVTEYSLSIVVDCDDTYKPNDPSYGLGWYERKGFPKITPDPVIPKKQDILPQPNADTIQRPPDIISPFIPVIPKDAPISYTYLPPKPKEPPVKECSQCKPILENIKLKQHEYDTVAAEIKALEPKIVANRNAINKAQAKVKTAKEALQRFDNPQNWISSEGRTITQTDLEVRRMAMQDAWSNYVGGSWTAQDLENYWNSFTDEQREEYKQKARDRLLKDIEEAQAEFDRLQKKQDILNANLASLQKILQEVISAIEKLKQQYLECLKTCFPERTFVQITPSSCTQPLFVTQEGCSSECPGTCVPTLENCYTCLPSCTHAKAPSGLFSSPEACKQQCKGTCDTIYLRHPEHPQAQSTPCSKCAPCELPATDQETCQKTCVQSCTEKTKGCFTCEKPCYNKEHCFENCQKPFACKQQPLEKSKNAGCWACEPPTCEQLLYSGTQTFSTIQSCRGSCAGTCMARNVPSVGITCFTCQRDTVVIGDSYSAPIIGYSDCKCPPGHTKEPPSPEYILGVLQKYTCVSGVRIQVPSTGVNGCYCYGSPTVAIDEKPAMCDSKCGPLRCGMTTSCSCPDKPNCVITATCSWQGWKHSGGNMYTAVVK